MTSTVLVLKKVNAFVREWYPLFICMVLIADLIWFGALTMKGEWNQYSAAYQECVADGHKGYECQVMLTGGRR